MKKFIEKIKNYFSAKDLDVYDDLPIEEQYYRLRIRSIKEAEKNSRFFLVILVVLLIFLLVAIVVASFADTSDEASAVTASAAEEVPANEVLYTNYEINLAQAPLHYFIPYYAYQTLSPTITVHFREDILVYQKFNGEISPTMFFVYQVIDDLGNIYYENVGRAGGLRNVGVNSNGQYSFNDNSLVGLTFRDPGSAFWRHPDTNSSLFAPLVSYNLEIPFTIYVSSQKSIDLHNLKVRSCALHDLQTYGLKEDRIWFTYSFTNTTPSNHSQLEVFDFSTTQSSSPDYPVSQSPEVQYNLGYNEGYDYGYQTGYNGAYSVGFDEGSSKGFDEGFNRGVERGKIEGAANANDYSFLSLASSVFDAPIALIVGSMQDTNGDGIADTRVGGLLNFDLLGVNIASFLLAIFTVCVIIALVKLFISR